MIPIEQLLESMDLDFEPRWVTKDKSGLITIWADKPSKDFASNVWIRGRTGFVVLPRIKLVDFADKPWQECIYEVPRTTTGDIEKLGKLNLSATNMTMNQNAVDTVVNTLNRVIDAVNKHADIIQQIGDWGARKGECLWCEKLTSVNLGK